MGLLILYIPSVLWSRSLMSWKFLCSSKGRFSIPREKRSNWDSVACTGLIAAFQVQVQNRTQISLLWTVGCIWDSNPHSFLRSASVCLSSQLTSLSLYSSPPSETTNQPFPFLCSQSLPPSPLLSNSQISSWYPPPLITYKLPICAPFSSQNVFF